MRTPPSPGTAYRRGTSVKRITPALEATHGQIDGFFSQLPYKCHLEEVALWEIDFRFAPGLPPGWFCPRAERRGGREGRLPSHRSSWPRASASSPSQRRIPPCQLS